MLPVTAWPSFNSVVKLPLQSTESGPAWRRSQELPGTLNPGVFGKFYLRVDRGIRDYSQTCAMCRQVEAKKLKEPIPNTGGCRPTTSTSCVRVMPLDIATWRVPGTHHTSLAINSDADVLVKAGFSWVCAVWSRSRKLHHTLAADDRNQLLQKVARSHGLWSGASVIAPAKTGVRVPSSARCRAGTAS
jgi:hypothetical protein